VKQFRRPCYPWLEPLEPAFIRVKQFHRSSQPWLERIERMNPTRRVKKLRLHRRPWLEREERTILARNWDISGISPAFSLRDQRLCRALVGSPIRNQRLSVLRDIQIISCRNLDLLFL
jgi:hypothetical protein